MRVYAFLSIIFLLPLLLTFSAVPTHAASIWDFQTVDIKTEGYGYGNCPIAVDSNNNAHILYTGCYIYNESYHHYYLPTVKYARWNGSSWSTQKIASGTAFDIELDTNHNPHILYDSSGLTYARWEGKNWVNKTVDITGAGFGSLALDSSGNPHIAYTNGREVKYASWNGSSWRLLLVDTSEDMPFSLFFALDAKDTPYIMYCNPTSYIDNNTGVDYRSINVSLATLKSGSWSIEPVLSSYNLSDYGQMVLDSKGNPHFVCTQHHRENFTLVRTLLYASWDGVAWNTQTVVSNAGLEENYWTRTIGFLSLDIHDLPHISYLTSSHELVYTSWTGTAWNTQTVNTNITAKGPYYLAVDSNGNPHISYRGYAPDRSIDDPIAYVMYATTTALTQPSSPTFSATSLILLTAVIITGVTVVTVVYVWKKT